jgi:hypothetical protein
VVDTQRNILRVPRVDWLERQIVVEPKPDTKHALRDRVRVLRAICSLLLTGHREVALIIAPTPLVAANFIILGRIIRRLGPQYSRLTPRRCKLS